MKISEVVQHYIAARDRKTALKTEYDAKVASIDIALAQIESKLLAVFQTSGMNSVKTPFGTAYMSERNSATVADREIFMAHVIGKEEWGLLEIRCSKAAVEQFKTEHNDIPPGVSWRSEKTINVRRS